MSAIRRQTSTAARAFLALPAGVVGAALVLAGRPGRAARWQAWVSGGRGWTGGRVLGRAALGLPLDAAAFLLVGYSLFNSVRNFGYPVWYLDTDYHQAWGGPTMAGVWAVHAAGWGLCLYVLLRWPVGWLARGQRALGERLLGGRPPVSGVQVTSSGLVKAGLV
ncbi:hypothetical protein ACFV84_15490 [Kitasatospora sp. NPDC059811]|uniref:hypothetical protein n=1 Tax=Streptomycetaceae TaxID=2062 RepID=UPI0007AF4D0B|nr:hypothetical protein [Streptomyces sp. MJM8645]